MLSIKTICGLATLYKFNNVADFVTFILTLGVQLFFFSRNIFGQSDQTQSFTENSHQKKIW